MPDDLRKLLLKTKQFANRWRTKTKVARDRRRLSVERAKEIVEEQAEGDITMYTDEMQRRRDNLRGSAEIIKSLDRWWISCLLSSETTNLVMPKAEYMDFHARLSNAFKRGAISRNAPKYDRMNRRRRSISSLEMLQAVSASFSQHINDAPTQNDSDAHKQESVTLREGSAAALKAMRASSLNAEEEEEQKKIAEADWERDSMGTGSVSRTRFHRSLFELADLWCDAAKEADYVNFLRCRGGAFLTLASLWRKLTAWWMFSTNHRNGEVAFSETTLWQACSREQTLWRAFYSKGLIMPATFQRHPLTLRTRTKNIIQRIPSILQTHLICVRGTPKMNQMMAGTKGEEKARKSCRHTLLVEKQAYQAKILWVAIARVAVLTHAPRAASFLTLLCQISSADLRPNLM